MSKYGFLNSNFKELAADTGQGNGPVISRIARGVFLEYRVTDASFHISGISPVWSDTLKITDNGNTTELEVFLKNSAGRPSGPALLFALRPLVYFRTITGDTYKLDILTTDLLGNLVGFITPLS